MRAPLRSVLSSRLIHSHFISSVNKKVFLWLVSLVTTAGILSWIVIGLTYLRFYNALRVQDIPRDRLPYKSPFQPYLTVCDFFHSLDGLVFIAFGQYYGLVMNTLVLVFSGWLSFVPSFKISLFLSNYLNW